MKTMFQQWFVFVFLCFSFLGIGQKMITTEQKYYDFLQRKITVQQDPPLPPCPNVTEWNGSSWSNGLPTADKAAIFSGDFTSSIDMTACLVWVTNGAIVTFSNASGTATPSLTVYYEVTVDTGSTLHFQHNTSLVQVVDNIPNSGNIIYDRQTPKIIWSDYTYWSSPVTNHLLIDVSLNTQIDKFYKWDPVINNWVYTPPSTTNMESGKGYIIRGDDDFDPLPQKFTADFVGVPINGPITAPVTVAASAFNLIGNPFPSAISADCFLNDSSNSNLGSLYFWTHNTPIDMTGGTPGTQTYNYNINDYAAYNLMGGVGTGIVNVGNREISTNKSEGNIAAGQGFFVKAVTSGNATFKNSMRPTGNNSQFFRSNSPQGIISNCNSVDKSRLWIQIWDKGSSPDQFKQTLLGYSPQATTSATIDRLYDAPVFTVNPTINIYTLWNATSTEKLTIQGRYLGASFNVNEVVPLGFSCPISTEVEIRASDWDGLFDNQAFLLRETISPGVYNYYDIRNTPYTFSTTTAITDNTTRFAIVFTAPYPTQINSSFCGTTLTTSNQNLSISPNYGNAQMYRFNVVNTVTGDTGFREQTSPNNFNLCSSTMTGYGTSTVIPFIRPGSTYEITVQVKVGGVWYPPGNACQVTLPLITVGTPVCGSNVTQETPIQMINGINGQIFACEITNIGSGEVRLITLPSPWGLKLKLAWGNYINGANFAGFYAVNNSYSIRYASFNSATNTPFDNWSAPCVFTLVAAREKAANFEISAYPNPFENNFTLDIQTSNNGSIDIQVFDLLGKRIDKRQVDLTNFDEKISLGDNYATGVYIILVTQGENKQLIKMIKQ